MIYGLAGCIILICFLFSKLYLMKKAVREIREELGAQVTLDTNSLISISSRDKDMRGLADTLNKIMCQLRDSYHRFQEGDMERKQMLTNLSHDLRTPLTSILGYLSLIGRMEQPEELKRCLSIIEERALFMKRLTEELFAYSVAAGEEQISLEAVFVNQVLEDALMDYYAVLEGKGIHPVVHITEKRIIRNLNPLYLERIFSNLISNVVKYSDGDFEVSLTDDGRITFCNSAKDISGVDVDQLFHRFFTVQTGRNSTGLGLSIAKSFVEKMGGQFAARYEQGKIYIEILF